MKKAMLRQDLGWGLKRMRQKLYVRRIGWGKKDWDYLKIIRFGGGTENQHDCIMYVNRHGEEESWNPDADDLVSSDYYEFFLTSRKVKKRHLRTK